MDGFPAMVRLPEQVKQHKHTAEIVIVCGIAGRRRLLVIGKTDDVLIRLFKIHRLIIIENAGAANGNAAAVMVKPLPLRYNAKTGGIYDIY
jgi:hypothetical protein